MHRPGPGVGGHCISVDPNFLAARVPEIARLVRLARETNEAQPGHVASRVLELCQAHESPRVAVLGVAYKGNVDDVRETPATPVLRALEEAGVPFAIHDPHVRGYSWECGGLRAALEDATLVLLLCDHDEFRYLDPSALRETLRAAEVFDTREAIDHAKWADAGFRVHRLGAPSPPA